ncbi:SMP-30/gluconolactonase/LRE family protein [Acidovorax cavernicola]|uniref:SMP-30/gluconolactonase/LRE family protein n=1 Tax=Acidovorax cavernicola TaxID=1675792 RepID=A0A9X8GU64_9BURK|nr:SMP-30/gluconolactonase/LRE family protein [Acidovorax cavernicola]RIX77530.1 SMP-30/gluconolactonase/LRE family protein [Acidovorax cavernicola]
MKAELVLDARNGTGESPVWHAAEQALYWVDIPARTLNRWHASEGPAQWRGDEMIACIAPRAGQPGEWIAGMESGLFSLRPRTDGTLAATPLAPVAHAAPGMRFNDGRCDRQGRFWVGTMLMDMAAGARVGRLYSYAQGDDSATLRLDDLIVPNGLAFSPDGRTMYLSDSHPSVQAVWAFDYDADTGTPRNQRLFVDMQPLPGRPDGAAMDVDGCYWICGNDAGLVHRFTPDGRLDRSLAVPVKKPAMCAFGGPNLDTLFVTSIRPGGVDLSDQPLAGGVFALRPGVTGVPEPAFGG